MGNGPVHTVIAEAKCPKTAQHESALNKEQLIDNAGSEYDTMQDDPTQVLALLTEQSSPPLSKEFLRTYPVVKHLKVHNRTYEVDQLEDTHEALTVIEVDEERMRGTLQDALCLVLLLVSSILR